MSEASRRVRDILALGSEGVVERILQDLTGTLQERLRDVFVHPEKGGIINMDSLKTDARVIVLRRDTLHALLRAAGRQGNVQDFMLAGYEAGTLFGLGACRWMKENVGKDDPNYPATLSPVDLVEACAIIDGASRWATMGFTPPGIQRTRTGWRCRLIIEDDFLSHELNELDEERRMRLGDEGPSESDPSKEVNDRRVDAERRYRTYREFWKPYLESSFTVMLGAWYALMKSKDGDRSLFPLLTAECVDLQFEENGKASFVFELQGPRHAEETMVKLADGIYLPYLQQQWRLVAKEARPVLDHFVKEMCRGHHTTAREAVPSALEWLLHQVDGTQRGAVANLLRVRLTLHTPHHGTDDVSMESARGYVRRSVPAILMAAREVRLDPAQQDLLRQALFPALAASANGD